MKEQTKNKTETGLKKKTHTKILDKEETSNSIELEYSFDVVTFCFFFF